MIYLTGVVVESFIFLFNLMEENVMQPLIIPILYFYINIYTKQEACL